MPTVLNFRFLALGAFIFFSLMGCASTDSPHASAQPVLYPNATFQRLGAAQARTETALCQSKAWEAGLSPEENNNEVARRSAQGAATAGVAAAVGALVTGRGADAVIKSGAAGAAVGGSAGAVSGAFQKNRPNPVYRQFVQRCLSEKGLDVIGWR